MRSVFLGARARFCGSSRLGLLRVCSGERGRFRRRIGDLVAGREGRGCGSATPLGAGVGVDWRG